jgi:hypothetical protein
MAIAKKSLASAGIAVGALLLGALAVRHRKASHAGDITPQFLVDVDRVWVDGYHPLKAGKLLREASSLSPEQAAKALMRRVAKAEAWDNYTTTLHSLGVAVGPLTRTRKSNDVRSIWRSTLPVMLISPSPQSHEKLAGAIALQLGFLIYGSDGTAQVNKAEAFAQAFSFSRQRTKT